VVVGRLMPWRVIATRSKTLKTQARKSRQARKPKGRRRKENAILRYFRQTWAELKKTSWPNRNEATKLTAIVASVTIVMSAVLGLVDWLFSLIFSLLVDVSG